MIWIVSASEGIVDNYLEMNSRMRFISNVTGEKVSSWKPYVNNRPRSPYCLIEIDDGFDGVFITAHFAHGILPVDVFQGTHSHEGSGFFMEDT